MKKLLFTGLIVASAFSGYAQAATINRNVSVSYNLDTLDTKIGFVTNTSASFYELVTTKTVELSLFQILNSSVFTLYSDTNSALNKVSFNDATGSSVALNTASKYASFTLLAGQYVLKLNAAPLSSIGVTIATVPLPASAWLFSSVLMAAGMLRRKQTL